MIKFKIHNKYIRKGSDDFNQELKDWSIELLELGYKRKSYGDIMESDLSYLNFSHFLTIMNLEGSSVTGYKPIIKIATSGMTDIIPEGLPNGVKLNVLVDSGDTNPDNWVYEDQIKNWDEWVMDNHHPTVIDDYTYFPCNWGNPPGGAALTGSVIMIIHNAGIELINSIPKIEEPQQ